MRRRANFGTSAFHATLFKCEYDYAFVRSYTRGIRVNKKQTKNQWN